MPTQFARLVYWHDRTLIHPEDLARLDRICAGQCVLSYEMRPRDQNYLVLAIAGETFRVKESALQPLPTPRYRVGSRVRTTNGTPRTGWISQIGWHTKEGRHMYFLEVEGKAAPRRRVSRRYWEEDLEPDERP